MRGDYVHISPAQLQAGGGQQDVDYVLDRPPYTRYIWNGSAYQAASGPITRYTSTQLTALAAAGGLTPGARYIESDTGVERRAPSASTLTTGEYGGGARCATFADSMTDYNYNQLSSSSITATVFDPATNRLTLTWSGHACIKGSPLNIYNRVYPSLYKSIHVTVESIISTSSLTIILPGAIGAYPDLPSGALTGSLNAANLLAKCAKGWFTQLNMRLNQRFDLLVHSPQSGDTTSDLLARLPAEMVLWQTAGVNLVVMHQIGINDLSPDSITHTNDFQRTITNLTTIFDTIRIAGYRMLVSTVTPVASGEAERANKTSMALAAKLARWMRNYASKYAAQVILIDAWGVVVNPTDATGLARAGYTNTADKIHLSNVGAFRIAKALSSQVAAAFPGYMSTLPASVNDSASSAIAISAKTIDANGMVTITAAGSKMIKGQEIFVTGATGVYGPAAWAGVNGRHVVYETDSSGSYRFQTSVTNNAGTVTGTLVATTSRQLVSDPLLQTVTGGTVSAPLTGTAAGIMLVSSGGTVTGVASVIAEPGGFGNEQIVTVSAASAADYVRFAFKSSTTHISPLMIPGRRYLLECQLRMTTAANWANSPIDYIYCNLGLTANASAETWTVWDSLSPTSDSSVPMLSTGDALTETLHFRTAEFTIPSDTSTINSAQLNVYVYFKGTVSESLILGCSRIAVRDVTADGSEAG